MTNLTKKAIGDSFIKLLTSKNLGDITVKDIVSDLGINRKTFYYYYSDIYALANELFNENISQIEQSFIPDETSYIDALMKFAEYMRENKKITMHIYRTIGYEKMSELFFNTAMKYYPNRFKDIVKDYNVLPEDFHRISEYYAFTLANLLTRWIKDGMQTVPESEINRFLAIMSGTTELALKNAEKLNK